MYLQTSNAQLYWGAGGGGERRAVWGEAVNEGAVLGGEAMNTGAVLGGGGKRRGGIEGGRR